MYDSTYVNEDKLKQELKSYMQSHGVWFNDENYKLGTRDLLNILSVVSAFCVYHIKFIVAPLFDHIDSTYIVYFSDDLLNSSDFKAIPTLSTSKININKPINTDTNMNIVTQKNTNYRNDIITASDVNTLLT